MKTPVEIQTAGPATVAHSVFFQDNAAVEGHARKSFHGGIMSVGSRVANAVVQISSVIFLARLLSPVDYGLVTMVSAITGFAPMLVDLGTRDAVAQREQITEGEVSALFWITMGIGCLFGLAVALSGPLIAGFYHEPRLVAIALYSSLTVLASAAVSQHQGLMRRAMMFREIAILEVASNIAATAVALAMAFQGLGYWALVIRPVVAGTLSIIGYAYYCRWIPGWPVITKGVRDMVRFGLNILGFVVIDFVTRSLDSVAIGRMQGAESLGYYRKALLVYDNTLDVTVAVHGVASVSLSKLRKEPEALKRLWARGVSTVAFYGMPAFGGLAVIAPDLIVVLLTKKWTAAGILLGVLALRGIPHVLERTLGWLHVAAGRADRWLRWGWVVAVVQLVALFCGLPYGSMGIAIAYVIATSILSYPAIIYAGHPLGIGAKDVVRATWAPLVGTLLAVAVGVLLRSTVLVGLSPFLRVLAGGAAFVITYLALVPGLFGLRQPVTDMLTYLRPKKPTPAFGVEAPVPVETGSKEKG